MAEERYRMNGRPWRAGLFDYLERASAFALANLLWVVCSLPLVTAPAATAGLFAVMADWVRGLSPEPLAVFWAGMRRHWLKSTILALLDLAIAALVAANLLIFRLMDIGQPAAWLSLSVTVLAALLALMVNLYAWPLLVLLDLPLRDLLQKSLKLALAHPGWTLLVMIAAASPLPVSLLLPRGVLLMASFSACALIASWGAWRIIRHYVDASLF